MNVTLSILRLPLLALSIASLAMAALAGLGRLGWPVPAVALDAVGAHAALFIGAFFGTVIGLERAVAYARPWAYFAPLAAAGSGAALLVAADSPVAPALAVVAAAVLVAASTGILRRVAAPFTAVMTLASACWLAGNLAWLAGADSGAVVPAWLAFLVLTVAGERLELSRLRPAPAYAQRMFLLATGMTVLGALLSAFVVDSGRVVYSIGLVGLGVWLLRYDIASHSVRFGGLPRFVAHSLRAGYLWLGLAGLLGLFGAFEPGDPLRDAAVHAVALGFVFSMVLGHAPIILPAVARVRLPYSRAFYLPLIALHASLAVRVAGVVSEDFGLRRLGGLANACALALFLAVVLASVVAARFTRKEILDERS